MIVRSLDGARLLCTLKAASLTRRHTRLDKCIYAFIPTVEAMAPGRGELRGKRTMRNLSQRGPENWG